MLRSAHLIFTYFDIFLAGAVIRCIEKYVNKMDGCVTNPIKSNQNPLFMSIFRKLL